MEPEQNTPSTPEVNKEKHPVFCVTPLSKYLAMALFILLPFLGGYVGYVYAPEKVVEVEKIVEVEKSVNELNQAPETNDPPVLTTENGFTINIPTEWDYRLSEVSADAMETFDVFDEEENLAMIVIAASIPRGHEGDGRSFSKDAPIKTSVGDVNKFSTSIIETGQGALIFNYGFMEEGIEITVPFGPEPYARNANEHELGTGVPLRYETEAEAQEDPLINGIIESLSK